MKKTETPSKGELAPMEGYRNNSRRTAIDGLVQQLCKEEDVGFVDVWDSVVAKEDMNMIDGIHLSGKGAAVVDDELKRAVDSGLGKTCYLKWMSRGNSQRSLTADKRIPVPR